MLTLQTDLTFAQQGSKLLYLTLTLVILRTKTAPVVVAAFENLGPKTRTLKHGGAGRKFLDVVTGVADA